MEKTLFCKICGEVRQKGRKLCVSCNRKRCSRYKERHYELRVARSLKVCPLCGEIKPFWRKKSEMCGSCYKDSCKTGFVKNPYFFRGKTSKHEHRCKVEDLLGKKLSSNEIVHHLDEDPQNNNLENLWVMSRRDHGRLHKFLRIQRVIWEKSQNENSVNCWDSLRVIQTTAWLEITGAKVLKLDELANQQPSILKDEGSETKDGNPECSEE